MKKRIFSLFLALLIITGTVTLTLLSVSAEESGGTVIEDTDADKPVIRLDTPHTHWTSNSKVKDYAKPLSSGELYVRFLVEGTLTEPVTVYYATEDRTAIASAGDYEATTGSVVLTPENPVAEIYIKTARTDYSITVNVHKGSKTYRYFSRTFMVKITGISGNAVVDENNKEVECALLAEHNLLAYEYDGTPVLSPFTSYENYTLSNVLRTDPCDAGEAEYKSVPVNFPMSWTTDYVNSGIGAKLYMALRDAHIDEGWNNDTASVTVYVAQVSYNLKGEFHDNEEFGLGPALLGQSGSGGKMEDYYEDNFIWCSWRVDDDGYSAAIYGPSNKNSYTGDGGVSSAFSKKYVIRRRWDYFGEPGSNSKDPGEYYLRLRNSILNWKEIEIALRNDGGHERRLSGGSITFRLEDVTAPQIKTNSDGSYEIYHNFNTVKKGDKLRMTIRFNEPVRIDGKDPYITGKVNGNGAIAYAIRFNYVGGSGTDTLCFEAEYSGKYQISSLTDLKFINASSIKDFGGAANSFVSPANLMVDGFNLDIREPHITVSLADSKMVSGEWARSKSIPITVSNISETATLYYSWTDSDVAPLEYENKLTLNNISVNGTQTVTIVGDGDGTKYLHLKAVSRFGQEGKTITVADVGASKTEAFLGPYYFDNTAPTIDESKLVPGSGSGMDEKVYTFPTPFDAGSGFSELKMYYVDVNGENCLISDKTYTATNGNAQIKLNAAEVGVGDNDRREITIFFTLTDAAGNIDEDVARHTVLFDTHTYISIESAGSASQYNEKTEYLDEGYTLIYTGNVKTEHDEHGYCYIFEIKVSASELRNPKMVIMKDGRQLVEDGFGESSDYIVDVDDKTNYPIVTLSIQFTKPMEDGYYDIYLANYESKQGVGDPLQVSRTYRVYVGSGAGKLKETLNKGTVLVNKVYQLPSYSYFYYMDTANNHTIGTVVREAYNNSTLAASFSSQTKALEYVMFNEYRDLYAIRLTQELADSLNEGNSSAQKALGEETVAREGQVWIRYKSASWDAEKAPTSTDWVFYYYGSSEEIDVSYFSNLLNGAITSIAQRIVSKGQTVALTDLSVSNSSVGATLVDKTGAPYLAPVQVHASDKRLSGELCNSTFLTDITFLADSAIYSSNVVINGIEYTLIGNTLIPSGGRYQYKYIDESGREDASWTDIHYTNGQRFGDILVKSGKYKIRELGDKGVSVFNAYIDKDSPMVLISWRDKDGVIHSQLVNQSSEKQFRSKTFKVVGIDSREYDKYSYVAFYNTTNLKLYGVYTLAELHTSSADIPDGNYYMVISDRSGNSYMMTIHINSSELKCEIKENENVKIKFTCDRKDSQIQEFYVKRNGALISGKYASELEFTESGTYEFYVRDIYGNVYSEEYVFNRVYPEVLWKYRDTTGYFVSYDPQNKTKYFSIEGVADGTYAISTSVNLKFQITGDYGYTFLGVVPEFEENIRDNTVTIKSTQAFQLKVYYKKHPDVYTIYNCYADTTAPIIDASIEVITPIPDEIEILKNAAASGTIGNSGSKLIPPRISYSAADKQIKYLKNNDKILSDLITVDVHDDSGLAYLHVYLDGTLIKELDSAGAASALILNRAGTYRIVAEDMLGNKSELNFTNGTPNSFTYVVDGLPYTIGLNDFENFDENGNYMDCVYGSEYVTLVITEQMKAFYMISDSDGSKHFVAFDVRDKAIYEVYYCLDSENNLVLETVEKPLLDGKNSKTSLNVEHVIYEIKDMGVKIYGQINENGSVVLTVYSNDRRSLTVETRLNTDYKECYYTKTELSNHFSDLQIQTSDGNLTISKTDELIKLNRPFSIFEANFDEDKISYVAVYYSKVNDFDEVGFFSKDEIYASGKLFENEGFYLIMLVNEYGNDSVFLIHISYKFDVTSYAEFANGEKAHYSADYSNMLYSDHKIVFEVYANSVNINVTKDGKAFNPIVSIENGITYIILSEPGFYAVTLSDAYKNTVERGARIDSSKLSFKEDLLTGYNENALKRDEGYTNQPLSVSKSVLDKANICYLEVQYDGKSEILYDSISESGVALDEKRLSNIIGSLGDGVYTLIARNRYGAEFSKVIHYRGTPTLILEREIRTSTEVEPYDIDLAVSVGFWSNSELIFKTDAEYYKFTINGDKTECPKKLSFTGADQQGRSEYEITYVDEYGFSYSFTAYLVRQELEILPELLDEGVYINGVLTTTDDIVISFSESAHCTYTWNNSEEMTYTPGQKLSKDGVYRFVAVDYAGNMTAMTIKKDTIVEFEFIDANSSAILQSGGVVNSSKVEFAPLNGDSAYIEKVYRNGVAQNNFKESKFSEDGKWELIISDELGNKSYFCFYIITKQKNGFAYMTPYEYLVTELWYDSGDGVKISYLKFVTHTESSSSFEFTENGTYTVVMASTVTGSVSEFKFTINTNAPKVSLVGCNEGETTINDVSISGYVVGDTIRVYKITDTGEKLVQTVEVTSLSTKIPTINEGGKYRIVVESEAGVTTELSFVRKHVMNTEGSIFIMIVIGLAVIGLVTGLVYRNKSKTDK